MMDKTWWHWTKALAGSGMMSMALVGLIMVEIYMIETELINSDLSNLLVDIYDELSWFLMGFTELI